MKTRLIYALHSGNLYGTERMALATLEGLGDTFESVLLAPPGPALDEGSRLGFTTAAFAGPRDFVTQLPPWLADCRQLGFVATGVVHSLAFIGWNAIYRRPAVHLHIVHGGTDERLSYGRKKLLNRSGVVFVAVSGFVRERLIAHGVAADKIRVIENFLSSERIRSIPRRALFERDGIRRIVVVSRVDPIKRVDLLLEALDRHPVLSDLPVRVLGTGWDLETLQARARIHNPNVEFVGFSDRVPAELSAADLLLHLCPAEPFGLAILEAMAAGLPVLVPDSGGAGSLVEDGVSGFRFRADDADDLARRLLALRAAPAAQLNRVVAGGERALASRFSEAARIEDYRQLLRGINRV